MDFLQSSVTTMRTLILNAHPRLWRWRGEILGGLSSCWIHLLEEEGHISERASRGRGLDVDAQKASEVGFLKKQLKGTIYLLKTVLENPTDKTSDVNRTDAKEDVNCELRELVEAEDVLEELLFADIDPDDESYFE